MQENIDLWEHFICKEEYNNLFKDQYNRICSFSSSKAFHRPIVSERLKKNGFSPKYPDNKSFAICLTHDIDILYTPKKDLLKEAVKNLLCFNSRLGYSCKTLFNKYADHFISSIYNILETEAKYYARSTFYFLNLVKKEKDFNYLIGDVKYLIDDIVKLNNEIGLHGGHESYNNISNLIREKTNLEESIKMNVVGYRNHYLKFKTPETWEILSKTGFKYDTTYTYHDCIGYRNGMCHPYYPYNCNTEKFIDILEIPPLIMDFTLHDYMRFDKLTALNYCKKTIEDVASLNGAVSLLYHNRCLYGIDFYDKLLHFCNQNNGWLTSAKELYLWWTQHGYCEWYDSKEKIKTV